MAKRPVRRLNLKKTLFLLPNLITLSSIFCGFDAIRLSATGQGEEDFYRAALLIVFAMVFDMLDGRVARLTKTQSAFGLQIDSLADVVSFGVAPGILVYEWSLHHFGVGGLIASFLFVAAGAVRLARFNVLSMGESGQPTKPSKYVVGLPIPGAAGILVAIVVANHSTGGVIGNAGYAPLVLAVTLGLSALMVSTVRFRSFKEIKLDLPTAAFALFLVGSSAVVVTQTRPAFVLLHLLTCYVVLAIGESLWMVPGGLRKMREARRAAPLEPDDARSSIPPQD